MGIKKGTGMIALDLAAGSAKRSMLHFSFATSPLTSLHSQLIKKELRLLPAQSCEQDLKSWLDLPAGLHMSGSVYIACQAAYMLDR